MARIQSIVYLPLNARNDRGSDDFLREPVEQARLVAGHGIEGDRKAGRSKSRQINLLTGDWVARMEAAGYRSRPGQFGEQLVLEGVPFESLEPGYRLQLGAQAVLEITKPRTGCERLEAAQGREIPEDIKTAIGYMAQVVTGGTIRVGDPVVVLTAVSG